MAKKKESLMTAVSAEMKSSFNLDKFKEKKLLNTTVKFKEQRWIPFSEALQDSTSLPGAAIGHINLLRGHSNTGKTTALLELAINAQKMGILPVFIITEMKWSWEHTKQMGFQVEDVDPIIAKATVEPKTNYSLKTAPAAKVSKADKFDSLFDDEEESEGEGSPF